MKSNAELHEYGIQNEKSDMRIHVCPRVRRVYVYPTSAGRESLKKGIHTLGYQHQINFPTAEGLRVRPFDIAGFLEIKLPDEAIWDEINFSKSDGTSQKGRKAVKVVLYMAEKKLPPFVSNSKIEVIRDGLNQRDGVDIIAESSKGGRMRIQVKCDFDGGRRSLGGTGYLYLQTHECNPLSKH